MLLLKSLKKKLEIREAEIHEKMNENHRLKIRAATAWEEMTPRPSFKPVCFNFFEFFLLTFLKRLLIFLA